MSVTYLVTDIEGNGLIPGQHSMISITTVAVDHNGEERSRCTINLAPVEGTSRASGHGIAGDPARRVAMLIMTESHLGSD